LLLDLSSGRLLAEWEQEEMGFAAAARGEEGRGVRALLAELSRSKARVSRLLARRASGSAASKEPLASRLHLIRPALHLAGVHRLRDCEAWLREWEDVESRRSTLASVAFGDPWRVEPQAYRPIAQQSLRRLDVEPRGRAAYHFRRYDGPPITAPERSPDRRGRTRQVRPGLSARAVLTLLGSPDHIRTEWAEDGRSEVWEHDSRTAGGWVTFAILWGANGVELTEERPPDWARRERELFHW
jgi:hypothetical protein